MPRPKKNAVCHTDRPHCARGLCTQCYRKQIGSNLSPAAAAKRLVAGREYNRKLRLEHPEKARGYRRARRDDANEATRKWKLGNPDKVKAQLHAACLRKYKITPAQYAEMAAEQAGVCKICRQGNGPRRLAVDHCHATGAVRGLLCSACNYAVGWAEKRNADAIERLRAYVTPSSEEGAPPCRR